MSCVLCGEAVLRPLARAIRDYEYGVPWRSELRLCTSCGLVAQEPRVDAADIPKLYPRDYLAHGASSRSGGIYGRLKRILARHEARVLARYVPQNGGVVEVGCGNGAFLSTLHEVRPDVALAGVDIEDVGIAGLPELAFHHGQLEDVELPAASFDAVYCSNLIEHVADPAAFLAKCHAILRPGGVIVGVTPDHLSLDRYLFRRYWAGYHFPRHTFIFNHHNIRSLLQQAGFDVVRIAGSHAYWYLSLANLLVERPGTKRRGLAFGAITAAFAPFDLLVNLFRIHGSMTFVGRRPT